jgi:uncharacterized protein YkwD
LTKTGLAMIRRRNFLALGVAAACASCTFIEEPRLDYGSSTQPEAVNPARAAQAVNFVRAQHGASPLTFNPLLQQAALEQARAMAARDELSHNLGPGFSLRDRIERVGFEGPVGENLAGGQHTLEDALEGWLDSASHRATLLRQDYTLFGLASARAATRRSGGYGTYWTMILGAPSARPGR